MPRSFRLLPPEPQPELLARPRLMRSLVGRWDHRVTLLVGGAGLGKTTVLAQLVAENRLAPRGQDHWIGLEAQDADADGLARIVAALLAAGDDDRVAAAVGPIRSLTAVPTTTAAPATRMTASGETPTSAAIAPATTSITAVAAALWQRAPTEICLIFDDVHHLVAGSGGADWLAKLIDALPTNGHIVLASRAEPAISLSRLESQGSVLRLAEDELRFSPDELSGFAARRGVEEDQLADTGGWPALAELTANVDRRLTGVYLWEEVLEPLGDRRRDVLAALTDLGGADAPLASAVLGSDVDVVDALDGVPLVARTADGWHVPHALWRHAPGLTMDPNARVGLRRRAVQHLTELERFDDAFRLLEETELWELAPPLLRAACLASDRLISSQLERWLMSSPPAVRQSASGCLASGLLAAATAPTAAIEPLQLAIERCRADGDVDAEMTAIARLARSAWFLQDDALLGELVTRVVELEATGNPAAAALATVARAALVDLTGDDTAMLTMLESIGPSVLDRSWELLVTFWAAQVRMGMGETGPIHEIVAQLNPDDHPALQGAGRAMEVSAWWAEGKVDTALAEIPAMLAAMRAAGVRLNLYLALNGASLLYARLGDVTTARRLFDESTAAQPPSTGRMTARSSMALAYIHLAEGDEEQAAAVLRAAIEAHGLEEGIDRDTWRQHIAVSYVLVPETREHWDGRTLHGHLHTARRLAEAIVAVRQGEATTALRSFDLPPTGVVRSALDVRFAAELAVGLAAAGRTGDGRTLLESLGAVGRAALRDLATAPGTRAKPAKTLLAAVPAAPPRSTYVAVLGPSTLRRDGPDNETVVDADLRRAKPQALLGYLVLHRKTTRAALAAALWPELDERAAANNLGVTLNHLLRVLEPWRHSGEPPYLLRLDGHTVHLVTGEHLRIDLDDFEHHVSASVRAEVEGVPSLALDHDLAAVELYRGDLFADLPDDEWFVLEREHYRIRFVGAAVRAGQLLLGRGDPDAAETVAHRALAVDRWAEEAYAVLIGAAMARHDRSGAHRMLRHCMDALDELGAQPSQATRQLRRRVLGVTV